MAFRRKSKSVVAPMYAVVVSHTNMDKPLVHGGILFEDELGKARPPETPEEAVWAVEHNFALPDVTGWTATVYEFAPRKIKAVKIKSVYEQWPGIERNPETGNWEMPKTEETEEEADVAECND